VISAFQDRIDHPLSDFDLLIRGSPTGRAGHFLRAGNFPNFGALFYFSAAGLGAKNQRSAQRRGDPFRDVGAHIKCAFDQSRAQSGQLSDGEEDLSIAVSLPQDRWCRAGMLRRVA
jgi:hypothetical protein